MDMTQAQKTDDTSKFLAGQQTNPRVTPGVIAAVAAGNALEFFDFLVYAIFAIFIGEAFFPADHPLTSLLVSLAVFGVGFVTRPLGGILFGYLGDTIGRRAALLWTIGFITLGSLGIALTPTYASIGIAAPIIVVVCRLLQGLALGGEVGPASAFLIEIAPKNRRGLYQGWQMASQGIGVLLAGVLGLSTSLVLTSGQLQSWGWRIPFLFSALLVPLTVFLRRRMPETVLHKSERREVSHATRARHGIGIKLFVAATVVIAGGAVTAYLGLYMTTYAIHTLKMPVRVALVATVIIGIFQFVFALLGGMLCDRFGRRPLMIYPRVVAVVVLVPLFKFLVAFPSVLSLMVVCACLAIINALAGGASLIAVPELFRPESRALGMGTIYAIGVAVFGGTVQFATTWLIHFTGSPAAPAWYVAGISLVAALAAMAMPETGGELPEYRQPNA
ncbi:MFS transporter [Bordetella sp. FB-8]|uniref:MFS transporter n=1 Tax=Bordetella sp. FB-8 TaxID=1159870 RepID=UPI0003619CF6|nr:MFS transporter [Bordetella sp. FB-8]